MTMAPDVGSIMYPHKAAEYSYRVPTPPRIVVPPPNLDQDALPQITLQTLRSDEFLNAVNYSRIITKNTVQDWEYERRREAQMILPFLYLGPMGCAKNDAFLAGTTTSTHSSSPDTDVGPITMLLHVRQKHGGLNRLMSGALQNAQARGIEQHTVEAAGVHELIQLFPRTTLLINAHLARVYQETGRLGRVLVFCESGNERSAAVVAAYVMETHVDVDYIKAMQLVQAQRFCANFDDNLKRCLQSYWDLIRARREVESASNGRQNGMVGVLNAPQKRTLQRDDEDDEMEMGDEDDVARFGGRGFAPFMDQP